MLPFVPPTPLLLDWRFKLVERISIEVPSCFGGCCSFLGCLLRLWDAFPPPPRWRELLTAPSCRKRGGATGAVGVVRSLQAVHRGELDHTHTHPSGRRVACVSLRAPARSVVSSMQRRVPAACRDWNFCRGLAVGSLLRTWPVLHRFLLVATREIGTVSCRHHGARFYAPVVGVESGMIGGR